MTVSVCVRLLLLTSTLLQAEAGKTAGSTEECAEGVTIKLKPTEHVDVAEAPLTARITSSNLSALLALPDLPLQLRLGGAGQQAGEMLDRVNMRALIEELAPVLNQRFAGRFVAAHDTITVPIPVARQLTIEVPDLYPEPYQGPQSEPIGFLLHDVTESEFLSIGVTAIQTARKLMDTGDPIYDRTTAQYIKWLADGEIEAARAERDRSILEEQEGKAIRARIAAALGVPLDSDGSGEAANWMKESRRFSYIIKQGEFIGRLKPLVDRINHEMDIAGFHPPSELDRPGIYYDPEIGDVDIVLPRPMLTKFLEQADHFELRMAEDAIISIEAVRLTDRDLLSGALASRIDASLQGVHDPQRIRRREIFRQLGLNSLLAVANQQLQISTYQGVAAGTIPDGVAPVVIGDPVLPPLITDRRTTLIGSSLSLGANPSFFDGREQSIGFSYIGPDGIQHRLALEVVDSLQELWSRIERNLIVHKIKKTDTLTEFSVPVGPNSKTFKGIAALIQQQNQQLVVATGTGAISELSATAGTWLVIEDFEITPIPGSSTTLTEEEIQAAESRILLTMFLRDPYMDSAMKRDLLATATREALSQKLRRIYEEQRLSPVNSGRTARTYGAIFEERSAETLSDASFEKKEANSSITLTFFSSQGNILQQPGVTQLGDSNDLTSFTTELRPNIVTPLSSFVSKAGSGTTEISPLTGADKGESSDEEKTMTHLLLRARFPTLDRERSDRVEGRHMGYFELPVKRDPLSHVDLPFLTSTDHPMQRLAKLRVGAMFDNLDATKIRRPFARFNPNRFPGDVPRGAWERASTRLLMNRKILDESPGAGEDLPEDYTERFTLEVRSLLEYDEDFFDAPNVALRNLSQWNDPQRIALALNNSPGRFALERLVAMLDELGELLVPQEYADQYLAYSPQAGKIYALSIDQLRIIRRDVAAHYLRYREAYGDAFLEGTSLVLELGTYASQDDDVLEAGPLRGYLDLVVLDNSGRLLSDPGLYAAAHENFLLLKRGGYKGRTFGRRSMLRLSHLPKEQRRLVYRGREILSTVDHSGRYEP